MVVPSVLTKLRSVALAAVEEAGVATAAAVVATMLVEEEGTMAEEVVDTVRERFLSVHPHADLPRRRWRRLWRARRWRL